MNASRSNAARRPLLRIVFCLLFAATACSASAQPQLSDNASAQAVVSTSSTVINGKTENSVKDALDKLDDGQRGVESATRPQAGGNKGGSGGGGSTTTTNRPGSPSTTAKLGSSTSTTASTNGSRSDTRKDLPQKGGETCQTTHPTTGSTSYQQCCADSSPVSCNAYDASETAGRITWPYDHEGYITFEYWTNGKLCQGGEVELERNTMLAFAAWSTTHPRMRVINRGATNETPILTQHENIIGCGASDCPGAGDVACASASAGSKPRFTILLNKGVTWDSWSCDPDHGTPCTAATGNTKHLHLQSSLTHEVGHILCYATHLRHSSAAKLTMFATTDPGERFRSTIGLGDALMARSCLGAAPLPNTHDD